MIPITPLTTKFNGTEAILLDRQGTAIAFFHDPQFADYIRDMINVSCGEGCFTPSELKEELTGT